MRNLLWALLIMIMVPFLLGCDRILSPEEARAVPGSADYCDDRERIIVSPGSYDAYARARAEYAKHCTGRSDEEKPEKDNPQSSE